VAQSGNYLSTGENKHQSAVSGETGLLNSKKDGQVTMIEKGTKWFMSALLILGIIASATTACAIAKRPEISPQLGHSKGVYSVAFSPDGKFVLSGSGDKTLCLWDVAMGKEIQIINY